MMAVEYATDRRDIASSYSCSIKQKNAGNAIGRERRRGVRPIFSHLAFFIPTPAGRKDN